MQKKNKIKTINNCKEFLTLLGIAGGYKLVDVTQKIHDSFKATEMSSWMDGLASGGYHRVKAGHDVLFNATDVYEKFGMKGLFFKYPIELAKDSLSKNGIPLPSTEGLVKSNMISHKVATDWMSLNIGEFFTGGVSIYSTYRLYKKSKKGKFNQKDVIFASIGIGIKMVGGVAQSNPILIITGLTDSVILLSNLATIKLMKKILKKSLPPIAATIATGVGSAAATTGAIGALATASTGTAISSLSGAAATNATLAWIGGGSIATGGLGVLGGTIILTGGASLVGLGAGYIVYKALKKKKINPRLKHFKKNKFIKKAS